MYRSESFGCLKCNTHTKVVMTPVPCTGITGPMVVTPVSCTGSTGLMVVAPVSCTGSTGPMVVTPMQCTGSNGPMVVTGTYELRAAVYKVSRKVSASCVSAAFRVASHTVQVALQGAMVCAVSDILQVVCHTVSLYVHLHTNRTFECHRGMT
jgi:hypothetical protein